MHDWMRIITQRHQDANNRLQVQTSCHAADLGMDAPQCSGTSGTSIWLSVLDDSIDEPVYLDISESVSRNFT
jgi:hypothetical protein